MKKRIASESYAIGIIALHFALSVAHGMSHARLGIALNGPQLVFVMIFTFAAPLLAGYLIWNGHFRSGGFLLAVAMAGSLAFGWHSHYTVPGPDNVYYPNPMASHRWQAVFEETAMDLAVAEAIGVVMGLVVFVKSFAQETKPEQASKG